MQEPWASRDDVLLLEDAAENFESRSFKLLQAERGLLGDRRAPGTAAILAADAEVEEPDAFTLAAVVEAVEAGPLAADWLRRDAARALAWLIRQSPAALAKVQGLLAQVDGPPSRGCLLDVARGLDALELVGPPHSPTES